MTNRGLSIKLLATPYTTDTYLVRLKCPDGSLPTERDPLQKFPLGMFLRRLNEDDQFARVVHEGKTLVQLRASACVPKMSRQVFHGASSPLRPTRPVERIEINIRQHMTTFNIPNIDDRINGFRIATPEIPERTRTGAEAFRVSAPSWDPLQNTMTMKMGDFGTTSTIDISAQNRTIKFIKLGFDFSFHPVCFVATSGGLTQKTHLKDRNGFLNYGTEAQQRSGRQMSICSSRVFTSAARLIRWPGAKCSTVGLQWS